MVPRQWFTFAISLAVACCCASAHAQEKARYLFVTVPEAIATANGKPIGKVYESNRLLYKKSNGTHYLAEFEENEQRKSGWVPASAVFLEPAFTSAQYDVIIRARELHFAARDACAEEEWKVARKAIDESLKLRKSVYGLGHPETADSLNLLGVIYMKLEDATPAERCYQQALDIRTKLLGADHPATIICLSNLAQLNKSRGEFAKAEPLYRQALERYTRAMGAEHVETALIQNNFGLLLLAQGDLDAAEPLLRKALATRQKKLGPKNSDTATSLRSLAALLEEKGDYAGAEPLRRQALEFLQGKRDDDHAETADTLLNLGMVLERQKKYAEAEPILKRAFAVQRQKAGELNQQKALSTLEELAAVTKATGNTAEAITLYRQAVDLHKKTPGAELKVADLTETLAKLVRDRGDSTAAETLDAQAKDLRTRLETPAVDGEQKRFALVIGNGAYVGNELRNPPKDAEAIDASLKQLGFQVTKKTDLDRKQMQSAIVEFRRKLTKDSLALFFFAGHGLQVNGENFLVPLKAELQEEFQVRDECYKVDTVLAAMEESKAALKVLILDCCRHNPFTRGWTRGTNDRGLAALNEIPTGTVIAFSTSPGKTALDGRGDNSPYTKHLVAGLRSRPPEGLEVTEVFRDASRAVKKEFGQVPWLNLDASLDRYYLWREMKPAGER